MDTFYEKYKHISDTWGLPEQEVNKVLDAATLRLADELLDDTEWNLSKFFKDRRSDSEYLVDLIEGVLFEELLVLWYRTNGHDAKRVGSDSDNKIIRSGKTKITTQADLMVDKKLVEVQVSRQGVRDAYHIKIGKAKRILKGLNTLVFIVGDRYFEVHKKDIEDAKVVRLPAWGNKEVYEITNPVYKSLK